VLLGLVEQESGVPAESSLEMLTFAREVAADAGGPLAVVAFGAEGDSIADELGAYGVEEVHHATHDRLDTYAPEAWGASVAQLATKLSANAVVAPGTDRGHEVLAHAGAELDQPVAANCTDVDADAGGSWEVTRHRWGGSLIEHARLDAGTKLLTAAEHEHPIEESATASDPGVTEFTPSLDDSQFRVQIDRVEESEVEGVPLGEARVVVGGGRGVGNSEDFETLEELADALGGTVGASRAAVYEGWRPHDDQIGLTGAKITADVYIACGISGAVQHMVGCKGAENILAINTDPEAEIMLHADYGVVGDLHEVVPELTEEIRERQ
jgi:electron transfer flavoprotein alpha subunit